MVDPRPPGNIGVKTRNRAFKYQYWTPTTNGQLSYSGECWRSSRPSYLKGSVITLPGGSTFRKSTSYRHESWELGSFRPYRVRGYVGPVSPGNYRASIDEREVSHITYSGWLSKATGFTALSQDARNETATKALNKIADQKVNLGENLATMGQTVRLLADKGSILYSALQSGFQNRSFKPYLLKSARDIYREGIDTVAARNYLEYVYGLKPLVQDVYTLTQLCKAMGIKTLILNSSSTTNRSYNFKTSGWTPLSYSDYRLISSTANVKVKTTIWARIDPDYQGLRALNQLGLLNPLGLAWDIVPFSFVVDWFLPVGPVLYALSAPAGLIFIDGSISGRTSQTSMFEYRTSSVGVPNPLTSVIEEEACVIPHTYDGYVRETLTNWPRPGLWIDPDPFRGDRSLKAIALAIMSLRGMRMNIR